MAVADAFLIEAAPAKINLTLRVLGRRADGYHDLESLVAFADVGDGVRLQPGVPLALEIGGPYAAACGAPADNLVLKAAAALAARVEGLKLGRFVLTKELPVASGIGGGSADAAAALRLLARSNELAHDDARLAQAALAVGADVPVCLDGLPRIMRGVGDELAAPLDLPELPALLVNPGVPLATRDVFAKYIAKFAGRHGDGAALTDVPRARADLLAWLGGQGNDLTQAAISCVPAIAGVLDALAALPGVRLARMSGSGPTCFVLFASAGEAAAAAQRLKAVHPDWWVRWVHCGRIGGGRS
jgi:4-diphosphocytidyl-2-C-methyl-D-erythritol kinase